jgi:hypothetical protein
VTPADSPERVVGEYLAHLTEDGVRALAQKIQEHRAVVVTDAPGFRAAKEARRSGEFQRYKLYISDRDLRIVVMSGLLLRRFEDHPDDQPRVQEIRQRLHARYRTTGVRQAEFVQRGMLLRVIDALEQTGLPRHEVARQVEALLRRVEKHTRFVREDDRIEQLAHEIAVRTLEEAPDTFIVFAKGRAREIAREAVRIAMRELPPNYVQHPEESGHDYVVMIGEAEDGHLRVEWWAPES